MKQPTTMLVTAGSPRERAVAFIDALVAAPGGANISIGAGRTVEGAPAIVVKVDGVAHAFLASEARRIAEFMENAIHAFPDDPEGAMLPNMIMGLRHAADRAEQEAAKTPP
jgi:hypothetical protein